MRIIDLSTSYLGLSLKNPIVASASPLSHTLDGIHRLEDAGAAAVVMYSLFEEQIEHDSMVLDHYLAYGAESHAEAVTYYPDLHSYNVGPEEYLNLIARAKRSVAIPVIGSLNGVSRGGWVEYARRVEQAGADALELNVYYLPIDPYLAGAEVEQMYLDVLCQVKQHVTIPVAVKLSPYFSATASMARQLAEAGADGLVLFNRFYQPDFDLDELAVVPRLSLSTSHELRLPLRWVSLLYGRIPVDFAITSGVHTGEDVLKGLMAGARVTMMASELLAHGIGRIGEILDEVCRWMEEREYQSVSELHGSMSAINAGAPAALERANYLKTLDSWRPDPSAVMSVPVSLPAD